MLTGALVNGPYALITTNKLEPWFYFNGYISELLMLEPWLYFNGYISGLLMFEPWFYFRVVDV